MATIRSCPHRAKNLYQQAKNVSKECEDEK